MGWFMKENDIYIGSMLDELNLRFAPSQGLATHHGGIDEMVALQKEFKILKKGRAFKTSVAALNLGSRNNEVKNRWLDLLGALSKHTSNIPKLDGDAAIVNSLVKNLAAKAPLPVYFTSNCAHARKGCSTTSIGAGCTIMAACTPSKTPRSRRRILPPPPSSAGVP